MKQDIGTLLNERVNTLASKDFEVLIAGALLIGFNLALMFCVYFYWMNPVVHQHLSGRPL